MTVAGGVITGARMKLEGESTWRNADFYENIVTGDERVR